MKEIKVSVNLFRYGGGVRQDKIRRFLQSNRYGFIHQFVEDEITYSMNLFVSEAVNDIIDLLSEEFPEYRFNEVAS